MAISQYPFLTRALRAIGVGVLIAYAFLMLSHSRAEVSVVFDIKLDAGGYVDVYFAQGDDPFDEYRKTRFFVEPGVWQTLSKSWALVPAISTFRIDADPRADFFQIRNPQFATRSSTLVADVGEFWERRYRANHAEIDQQTAESLTLAVVGIDPHIVFNVGPDDYPPAAGYLREVAIGLGVVAALLWGFLCRRVRMMWPPTSIS